MWAPSILWHPPIDAFEQVAKLCRRDCHHAISRRRPQEAAPFQPLREQAQALPVVPEHLDQSAAAATEYKQMPAMGITPQRLLNHERQAIEALAHVGVAGRQPDPRPIRHRDHRRRLTFASAFISAVTVITYTIFRTFRIEGFF